MLESISLSLVCVCVFVSKKKKAKMQNWLSNFHYFSFQSFNFQFCQFNLLTFNFCQCRIPLNSITGLLLTFSVFYFFIFFILELKEKKFEKKKKFKVNDNMKSKPRNHLVFTFQKGNAFKGNTFLIFFFFF